MYPRVSGPQLGPALQSAFLSALTVRSLCTGLVALCFFADHGFAQDSWKSKEIAIEAHQRASLGVTSAKPIALSSRSVVANGMVVSAPGNEWVVTAPMPATINQKLVDLGDTVEQGQTLAILTSPALGELRRQLEELAIEQIQAKAVLERERKLLAEGIIPLARLQVSETRLAVLQASERAKRSELASSALTVQAREAADISSGRLVAPMRGQLIEASVLPGQRVDAGAVLFRIANPGQLQLSLDLSLDKASQVRVGDRFTIQGSRAGGKIAGISRALHAGQQARIRGKLDSSAGLALGDLVTVEIQSRPSPLDAQIKLVPATALSQYRDRSIIFIETAKGFRAQAVEVLARLDGQVHIRGELLNHDHLAISGVTALRALLQKAE